MRQIHALFDRRRMRIYPRIILAVYALAALALLAASRHLVDPLGKPLGYDFITFWSASRLTLEGQPAAAFDSTAIGKAETVAVPGSGKLFLWHYPPTYQLAVTPLALLPYVPSYLCFTGATLLVYLLSLRRLLDQPEPFLLLLAFPATFICAFHGQNSFISAAAFASGILWLKSRPLASGLCFGLLAFKPQLGLLVPVALIAARQWRPLAAAAATALAYAALATWAFGLDLWHAFIQDGAVVRALLEKGLLPWAKMPTAFVFMRYFGVPEGLSYAMQFAVALLAVAIVARVWRRCGPSRLAGATLVAASLLVPPYLFDYELVLMAVPLAVLAGDMAERGPHRWERASLLLLYAAPGFMAGFAERTHLQIGFPLLVLALLLCGRRAWAAASGLRPVLPDVDDGDRIGVDAPPARPVV